MMNWSDQNTIAKFRDCSLQDYFMNIIPELKRNLNLDELTKFFSDNSEYRNDKNQEPAFKRRVVNPSDKKFREIYINYQTETIIDSVVWICNYSGGYKLRLSEFEEMFGEYKMHHQFRDNTTEFVFMPKNANIEHIETWHSGELVKNGSIFNEKDEDSGRVKGEILNPEFHYLTVSFKRK